MMSIRLLRRLTDALVLRLTHAKIAATIAAMIATIGLANFAN
jgi:hypothetical protein